MNNIIESNKKISEYMGISGTEEICYHKSWDFLIPVIHKITTDKYYTDEYNESLTIDYGSIERTYLSVLRFLMWYNIWKASSIYREYGWSIK